MQAPFFSMLLPSWIIGGPAVVEEELPNNKQGAKLSVSVQNMVAPKCNHDITGFKIVQSGLQILPFDQALHMRWDDTATKELSFTFQAW